MRWSIFQRSCCAIDCLLWVLLGGLQGHPIVRGALIKQVQGDLSKELRNKIITLITIDVHSRDIVGALITKRVENAQDFLWSSQLRYYWAADSRDADIRICDYRSVYSFEYVGNCGRLVITPLTDRCYVTLTTAIRLFLGGAPAGPAGTGKTETTKDLAKALAKQCVVFNWYVLHSCKVIT